MCCLAPSSVQDALVTLVDGDMINITWSPPAVLNGVIHQYIVKRINSSGTFYHHVSANQHHILLPYFNDALVFISAVNLFGQSDYEYAKTNGIIMYIAFITNTYFIICICMYVFVVPCLPSPCINNGTCTVNAADQLQCNCKEVHFGTFCENIDIDNVRM